MAVVHNYYKMIRTRSAGSKSVCSDRGKAINKANEDLRNSYKHTRTRAADQSPRCVIL
jgi:hypothetical protein